MVALEDKRPDAGWLVGVPIRALGKSLIERDFLALAKGRR